jgi:hypothetical protein
MNGVVRDMLHRTFLKGQPTSAAADLILGPGARERPVQIRAAFHASCARA